MFHLKNPDFYIEKDLVKQFKAGSEIAFELIFHRTKGKLMGFLTKTLPIGEDPESVLQDIYVKIWSNRKSIKTEKNFETFLFSISRNLIIDIFRKKIHKQKYLEELHYHLKNGNKNNLDTLATVEYSELEKLVFNLIEKLPPKRQEIFKLNKIEGLTYKQVASKLNISENTVDSQIRKALTFLRTEINQALIVIFCLFFPL